MIDEKQIGWLKEFLSGFCVTDMDRASVEEIVETFRALYRVLDVSKKMVNRHPAMYSPNSRKGALQEAIKPFIKVVPHD